MKSNCNKDMNRIRLSNDKLLKLIRCIIPFSRSNFKTYYYFFSCRPISFPSITALCGIECNKSFVKKNKFSNVTQTSFPHVKVCTNSLFLKKKFCFIEKKFQHEYFHLGLNFKKSFITILYPKVPIFSQDIQI